MKDFLTLCLKFMLILWVVIAISNFSKFYTIPVIGGVDIFPFAVGFAVGFLSKSVGAWLLSEDWYKILNKYSKQDTIENALGLIVLLVAIIVNYKLFL